MPNIFPSVTVVFISMVAILADVGMRNEAAELRSSTTGQPTHQAIQSLADLRRLLPSSLETNGIIAALGTPRWKEDLGPGKEVWHFALTPFLADDGMKGSYVDGVVVGITNGHLANWGCSYRVAPKSDVSGKTTVLVHGPARADSAILQLFLVHSKPENDSQYINTERLPKLGFVSRTPAMPIRTVKEVTLREQMFSNGQTSTNWSFGIFLPTEDVPNLKALTATNISKKLLIMVGNKPIVAPTIVGPIENGSLTIECQERSMMEYLRKQFSAFERQVP